MEDGLEQQLGRRFNRGQDLSGGQWQKVALGRAYMKDAEIMILDEYLPVIHPFAKGQLLFLLYVSDDQLVYNKYGILEPKLDISIRTNRFCLIVIYIMKFN